MVSSDLNFQNPSCFDFLKLIKANAIYALLWLHYSNVQTKTNRILVVVVK